MDYYGVMWIIMDFMDLYGFGSRGHQCLMNNFTLKFSFFLNLLISNLDSTVN